MRRVKLGLSKATAKPPSGQVSRFLCDGSEGGFAGLDHHAARRLQTTNVNAQRCYLRMHPHTPCTNSSNAPLLAPLDHPTHIAGTRTFQRRQYHHHTPHVQHRPLFRCGDSTFNLHRALGWPLSQPAAHPLASAHASAAAPAALLDQSRTANAWRGTQRSRLF